MLVHHFLSVGESVKFPRDKVAALVDGWPQCYFGVSFTYSLVVWATRIYICMVQVNNP